MVYKVDRNHKECKEALEQLGWCVHSTAMVGNGFVDLVAAKKWLNVLFEVKDGNLPHSKKKLTFMEKEFHERWTGLKHIVESVEDIITLNNHYTDMLNRASKMKLLE